MYNFDVSYFIDGLWLGLKCKIFERTTGSWCDGDSFTFNTSLDNVLYSFFQSWCHQYCWVCLEMSYCNEVNVKVVEEVEMNDVCACPYLYAIYRISTDGPRPPPEPYSSMVALHACMWCACALFIQCMYMYAACLCMSCQSSFSMFNI